MMNDRMRIGELTERAGVTQRTVRYYESIARLQKIDQLKKLGLSLDEIRDVIDLYFTDPSGVQPKQKVLAILRQHLAETDVKIDALEQFRAELQANIERFEHWLEEQEHR